jgi:membrane protease YdiL (CAAX protease family)
MIRFTGMILPLLFVYMAARAYWWATTQSWVLRGPDWIDGVVKLGIWVAPAILLTTLIRRGSLRDALDDLGLRRPAWRGIVLAAAATLPMAALLSVSPLVMVPLVGSVVLGPFAEEVLFRGFLFQQLLTRARWSMGWAALVSAVAFAVAHYKDLVDDLMMSFAFGRLTSEFGWIVPPTLAAIAGGCLFAWMTWRWQSLWPAVMLHAAVNFWWDIAPGAVGSPVASVAHTMALAAAAVGTWHLTKAPVNLQSGNRESGIAYREIDKPQSAIDW